MQGVATLPVEVEDSFVGIVAGEPYPVALHPDFLRVEVAAVPRTSGELLLVVVAEGQESGACSIGSSAGEGTWGRMWSVALVGPNVEAGDAASASEDVELASVQIGRTIWTNANSAGCLTLVEVLRQALP